MSDCANYVQWKFEQVCAQLVFVSALMRLVCLAKPIESARNLLVRRFKDFLACISPIFSHHTCACSTDNVRFVLDAR